MAKDPNSTYYDAGGIETLDIIKAKLTPEQYAGFLLGNVLKYAGRVNFKGAKARDSEKCAFYSRELSQLLSDQKTNDNNETAQTTQTTQKTKAADLPTLKPDWFLTMPTIK